MVSMDGSWCPSCGYSAQPGTQFCVSCGQQLTAAAPVGAAQGQPPTVTVQSPSMGQRPLSAPPMMPMPPANGQPPSGGPTPPPPPADSRLPWPPPPGGAPAPGRHGYPGGSQPPPGEQKLSDTMERMLRPQGLFQRPWEQGWPAPAGNGGQQASGPPPTGGPPPAGPYQGGGQYPPPPASGQGYQTEAMAQPGAGTQAGQYPPAPYPPGPGQQFAPGQYPGQYPPAPCGQGQYPGQYPADQYTPNPAGQYGPPGLYGPDGQFGPDGTPIADQKPPLKIGPFTLPRSPLIPAIVIGALVVIAVGAILFSASGGSGSTPGTASGGATPTATSSASASAAAAAQLTAAKSLSGLLAQSGKDRTNVIDAYTNVQDCGSNLGQDAQIFRTDAANRRALLAKLATLPERSALSGAMLGDLTTGWQASATVDDDLAKWADAAAKHCKNGDMHNASLKASLAFDGPATQGKTAFTALWNPLARKDGLPTYQNTQI